MKEPISPRYLDLKQAGVYLGNLTPETVRWMCRTGKLPHIKLGDELRGRIYIDKEDIDRVMRENKVAA